MQDKPIAELIAELRAANSKRTPGEWTVDRTFVDMPDGDFIALGSVDDLTKERELVAFIALAANSMDRLLEHIRELEEQLEGWEATQ